MSDAAELSRIGPFALEELLDGPGGTLYRGVHIEQRRSAAIRILPKSLLAAPEALAQFRNAEEKLRSLRHPNLVRCYGGQVDEGIPYLVWEIVPGESLAEQLERRGKLTWESATTIAIQVCRGLAEAHQHGVLHERISPLYVTMMESGEAKLAGFGMAWAERFHHAKPRVKARQARYLAPEQIRAKEDAGVAADLYGVGALLHEMLTGEQPFATADAASMYEMKKEGKCERVAAFDFDCPVWLDVLVARLMAPEPADRYDSAGNVVAALEEAQRNVASGVGTAQRALARGSRGLGPQADRAALTKIRKTKTRKKEETSLFESVWFLAICLALLAAGMTWALWPASEEQLYTKAAELMASDDSADWWRARDKYLEPLQERFPDGPHAKQVAKWLEQIEMKTTENRLRISAQFAKEPRNPAETLYREAWNAEQQGDVASALASYRELAGRYGQSEKEEESIIGRIGAQRVELLSSKNQRAPAKETAPKSSPQRPTTPTPEASTESASGPDPQTPDQSTASSPAH